MKSQITVSHLTQSKKILSTDQWMDMASTTNREPINESASAEKFIPDNKSKSFKHEQTYGTRSISTKFNFIDKINKFDFTDSKMEKKLTSEYHHWAANKKIMEIINKEDESHEILRFVERRQETFKSGHYRFKVDSKLNRKVWGA